MIVIIIIILSKSWFSFQINVEGYIFHNNIILLVYASDIDLRPKDGGRVWFRRETSPDIMKRALTDVQRVYPHISVIDSLAVVTWDHVGYAFLHTDKVPYFLE